MTNEEAIKELKEDRSLYESDIVDAGDGTPDGQLMLALDMAVEALEKQIPKKCETREGRMVYRCPSCGKWFVGSVDYMIYFDLGPRFCSICGQALDWDYHKYRLNKERDRNEQDDIHSK